MKKYILKIDSLVKTFSIIESGRDVAFSYENKDGMKATVEVLENLKNVKSVGIFIGPEGGFDEKEITKTLNANAKFISLGKRILRTETAAITSVSMCMLEIEKGSNQ